MGWTDITDTTTFSRKHWKMQAPSLDAVLKSAMYNDSSDKAYEKH